MPAARDHPMAAALGGRLYVIGGNSGNEVATVFAYDPGDDRWTRVRDLPGRRAAGGAVALDGRIVVAGGTGDTPTETYVYNPGDDTWTKGRNISAPREHLAMAEANGRAYLVGGRWNNVLMSTNEALDGPAGEWVTLAPLPTARGGTAAGAVNGRVYVAGGEAFGPSRTFPQVEVFDPATTTWTAAPDLPTPRHGLAVVGHEGQLYVIGGGPAAGLSVDAHNEALRPQ
jgi:N-acetylneuraminic acid mutarotase